jgi:hypothetical protein
MYHVRDTDRNQLFVLTFSIIVSSFGNSCNSIGVGIGIECCANLRIRVAALRMQSIPIPIPTPTPDDCREG